MQVLRGFPRAKCTSQHTVDHILSIPSCVECAILYLLHKGGLPCPRGDQIWLSRARRVSQIILLVVDYPPARLAKLHCHEQRGKNLNEVDHVLR